LATDNFTKNGLNWAIDRVKRIKKILKEIGVISVNQKGCYYYIHLAYIYTRNKIDNILGKEKVEKEETKPKEKTPTKSIFRSFLEDKKLDKKRIDFVIDTTKDIFIETNYTTPFNQLAFGKWIVYCQQNKIYYSKSNLKHWIEKCQKSLSIEQSEAIDIAISRKWKDFYIVDEDKSTYRKLMGESIIIQDKHCDTLIDIQYEKQKFIYIFKNITLKSDIKPEVLFKDYKYIEKLVPISNKVKNLLGKCFKKSI